MVITTANRGPADDAERTEALQEEVDELLDVLCDRFQRGPGADGGPDPQERT